jgi:hypothetical protein
MRTDTKRNILLVIIVLLVAPVVILIMNDQWPPWGPKRLAADTTKLPPPPPCDASKDATSYCQILTKINQLREQAWDPSAFQVLEYDIKSKKTHELIDDKQEIFLYKHLATCYFITLKKAYDEYIPSVSSCNDQKLSVIRNESLKLTLDGEQATQRSEIISDISALSSSCSIYVNISGNPENLCNESNFTSYQQQIISLRNRQVNSFHQANLNRASALLTDYERALSYSLVQIQNLNALNKTKVDLVEAERTIIKQQLIVNGRLISCLWNKIYNSIP